MFNLRHAIWPQGMGAIACAVTLCLSVGAQAQILDVDGRPNAGFANLYAWYEGSSFIGPDGIGPTPLWPNSQGLITRDIVSGFGFGGDTILDQVYLGNGNQAARFRNVVIWRTQAGWGTLPQGFTAFAVTSIGDTTEAGVWGTNAAPLSPIRADATGGNHLFVGDGGTLDAGAVTLNQFQVHSWVANGASSEYYIDGVLQASGNIGNLSIEGLVIAGRQNGANNADDLSIGDLLFYDSVLSTPDRQAVEGYLSQFTAPVGDIHSWASVNAVDTFATSAAWDAAGTPGATWDANVRSSKTQDQTAQVAADATVQFVNVIGNVELVLNPETNALDSTLRSMTLDVQNGVTLTATNGMSVKGNGVVTGSGTIAANVANDGGVINPGNSPGILGITGNYTQNSGGVFTVEMQGDTTAGTDYDQLQVSGAADLKGVLNIQPLGGYRPGIGSNSASWTIMTTGAGASGSFTAFNPTAVRDVVGIDYSVNIVGNNVVLDADFVYANGDADFDQDVDNSDILVLLGAGKFGDTVDGVDAGQNWVQGDFNQNGEFTNDDVLLILGDGLFGTGNYDPNASPFSALAATEDLLTGAILTINADGTAALDPNGLEINGLVIKSLGLDATEGGNDGLLSGIATLPFGVFQTNTVDEASSTFLNPTVSSLFALGQLIDQGAGLPELDDLVFSYTAVGVNGVQEGNVVIVPEPASLLLMGMGGLLVLRRRRAA